MNLLGGNKVSFDKNKIAELYPEAEDLMFEPMKIWSLPAGKESKLEEMLANEEYFASLKKDGAAYMFVKTENHSYLFGRTISKVTNLLTEKSANVPHIISALDKLPPRTIIVFEIYYPGGTSKSTTTIMGCLPQKAIARQKDNPIHAYAHDIIYLNGKDLRQVGALERYNMLFALWDEYSLSSFDFLELAQPIYDNILEAANQALADGEEGIVLRRKDGAWEEGKRPAWRTIKIKEHVEVDLVCMGFCPPTKEYTGKELETWQYWIKPYNNNLEQLSLTCMYGEDGWKPVTKYYAFKQPTAIKIGAYNNDGNLIELGTVSAGLTDEDKKNMEERPEDYLGMVVTIDGMSLDKKEFTVRHPSFKCWREDKNAKECLIEEIFR